MITRESRYHPPPRNFLGAIGRTVLTICAETGRATMLLVHGLLAMRHLAEPRARRETLMQLYLVGIKSLPVITVVAVFTGMILALQTGMELRRFNQEVYIGSAVMVSMLREMGPFMTGLILAACVGSAMAAQLGTMVVNEEVAALEIMAIDPVRFLVLPRLTAMLLMTPLLSFYTCILGTVGGAVVGIAQLHLPWQQYLDNALEFAKVKDLFVGMFKALLFGAIITTISCYEGFSTTHGAVGVGFSTRRAVISCFLVVLVVGYFVTRMFYAT